MRVSGDIIAKTAKVWKKPMKAVEAINVKNRAAILNTMEPGELGRHFFLEQLKKQYFKLEGTTYHNKKSDAGGPTKAGVTLDFARRYGIRNVSQLQKLTLDECWLMVYKTFFKKWKLYEIDDTEVISTVFLLCLNAGYGIKQVQDAINRVGDKEVRVQADNKIGPSTRGSLYVLSHSDKKNKLLKEIEREFIDYYNYLADKDPVQGAPNRRGWLNRVSRVVAFNNSIVKDINSEIIMHELV